MTNAKEISAERLAGQVEEIARDMAIHGYHKKRAWRFFAEIAGMSDVVKLEISPFQMLRIVEDWDFAGFTFDIDYPFTVTVEQG